MLVVGPGPAGLEAAHAACKAGASTALVDERADPGGQYLKQLAEPYRSAGTPSLDAQMEQGRQLAARVLADDIRYLDRALVWWPSRTEADELELGLLRDDRVWLLRPRAVVVATGATERPYPVPGWTLPGVMTTGGLQTLLRSYRTVPDGPIVVAGHGPLNFQLASELLAAGGNVAAIVESANPSAPSALLHAITAGAVPPGLMTRGLGYVFHLRRHGAPIYRGHAVGRLSCP